MKDLVFVSDDRSLNVRITVAARHHLDAVLARNGTALETGGVLLGRYSRDLDEAIVELAGGPPRDSVRGPSSFSRGVVGLSLLFSRAWRRRRSYLGEWHYHPGHQPNPSPTDRATVKAFANDPAMNCPTPVLLIVSAAAGDGYCYRAEALNKLGEWTRLGER
ncbi:MAG: Mov34/MPN/PAD-1 family protein [Dehalococcoidia bacterium]|nr:Mov34/MPN/PAD-1 family protein [Dehalococcoidia bacterium]